VSERKVLSYFLKLIMKLIMTEEEKDLKGKGEVRISYRLKKPESLWERRKRKVKEIIDLFKGEKPVTEEDRVFQEEQERINNKEMERLRAQKRLRREKEVRDGHERIVLKHKERVEKRFGREKEVEDTHERIEIEPKKKEFWFNLDGMETEEEIHKVFENLGYDTETTKISGDEGIDHILDGEIVVQTKNVRKGVGRPDLQQFYGAWKDDHTKGIFISIHGFTETCEEFVENKPIVLCDVNDVIEMNEGVYKPWYESSPKVTRTYPNGDKYEGEWKGGKEHGQGTKTYSNGDKYEGEWNDGEYHKGLITYYSSRSKCFAEFKDGKPWNGTTFRFDGNITGTYTNGKWRLNNDPSNTNPFKL